MDADRILERARWILSEEGNAILRKRSDLGAAFVELVQRIMALPGRVIVTGLGKSGIIGEKIAATLSSTGTPAFFLKPVDALHGDLGMARRASTGFRKKAGVPVEESEAAIFSPKIPDFP